MTTSVYDGSIIGPAPLVAATAAAQRRLEQRAKSLAPRLGDRLTAWMRRLAPSGRADAYFLHPSAFPSLLLPWIMETSLAGRPETDHAADLVYSTIAGYYFIRLIDNVMDGEATDEVGLLPAAALLHTEFERHYHTVFSVDDTFWAGFDRDWTQTAEAAIEDGAASDIDREQFAELAARKVLAARIPMRAVARRLIGAEIPTEWEDVFTQLSLFHQMRNDLLDWQRDEERKATTFFLCEARRRRAPEEAVSGWLAREGFDWAIDLLEQWLADAQRAAGAIGSADLDAYLARRGRDLQAAAAAMRPGLAAVAALVAASRRPAGAGSGAG